MDDVWLRLAEATKNERRVFPSSEELEAFEERWHVKLPSDLRDYFTTVGPAETWGKHLLLFLPFQGVKSAEEELAHWDHLRETLASLPNPREWFVFADYCIGIHYYAVRLTDNLETSGHPVVRLADGCEEVAPSFRAFFEHYLADEDFPPE